MMNFYVILRGPLGCGKSTVVYQCNKLKKKTLYKVTHQHCT